MCVERRPVHDGVACSAVPGGMPASAVTEAGDMTDEDLVRSEWVAVGAASQSQWLGHPLAGGSTVPEAPLGGQNSNSME
jgi:hypothetical protein